MYAVVVTGGKQYRVMQGETLRVELLDVEVGSEIKLDNVLMLGGSDGVKVSDGTSRCAPCRRGRGRRPWRRPTRP